MSLTYISYSYSAVRAGIVSEDAIDQALQNALSIRFRLGLFDPIDDQPFWNIPKDVVRSPEHIRLSKEATGQGIVLLKNDNNLIPIDISLLTIEPSPVVYGYGVAVLNATYPEPSPTRGDIFGNAMTSRIELAPVINITKRSKPKAKPACGGAP